MRLLALATMVCSGPGSVFGLTSCSDQYTAKGAIFGSEALLNSQSVMIPHKVKAVLDLYGLTPLEFEPGSTPTSEMAAQRIGVEVAQIAKSILLAGKDGVFRMAVLRGDRKLASGKVKKLTGVKHRMATAQEAQEQTGFRIGGVCPFGLNGIQVLIDQGLGEYERIYPAAGTDASGVPMHIQDLVRITQGQVCDIAQEVSLE